MGETARTKYYDGELIDFGNINMEFMTNGTDAVTYGLSLASIGEIAEGSGYKINEGCLVVDWTGANAEKSSVMVSIPVVCNEQSSVLHLEVFRNKLVSMSSLSNVTSLSAGARIYPNLFGTYENSEIMGEEKLVFALSVSDYTLMANIGTIVDPEWVDLKTVDGAFDNLNKCFVIPTKVGEDFVTVVGLKAVYTGTYFNAGEGDKFVAGEEDKLVELVLA